MNKILALAVGLVLTACGGASVADSCKAYFDAYDACATESGGTSTVDATFCDAYADYAGDATVQSELFDCWAAAFTDGDCSTTEGFAAAATASAECSAAE